MTLPEAAELEQWCKRQLDNGRALSHVEFEVQSQIQKIKARRPVVVTANTTPKIPQRTPTPRQRFITSLSQHMTATELQKVMRALNQNTVLATEGDFSRILAAVKERTDAKTVIGLLKGINV